MSNSIKPILLILFLAALLAVGVSAETNGPAPAVSGLPGVDVTVQSLFFTIEGLACWASRFVMIVMVIMIVWYGTQMMAAQGNDTKFTAARKSLTYAVIGILIVMGTYTIIATVGNSIQALDPDAPARAQRFTAFVPLNCSRY